MKFCPVCETDYPDDITVCPQDGATVRRPGERADPLVGRVIKGRYRVERQLGRGGMGAVYLAEQLSVGRKVALKILRGDFAHDEDFVARFRREAQLVAALNETRNPHVTLIHDFDQAEDGGVFIVMEWLVGRTLTEVIHRERLDVARAIRLATQIAEGLEAAHRAGVVHRDIKPQNIMVLDASDDIKLMDFGIARLRDANRPSLTRVGTMMGTPEYMSPEQIEGQDVTDKTDLYSFGVVFYEMLTGRVPFHADTPVAVLTKQLNETPVPPSHVRSDVSGEVEAIVMTALAKDPAQRQRDMTEVAQALHALSRQGIATPAARAPVGSTMVVDAGTMVTPRARDVTMPPSPPPRDATMVVSTPRDEEEPSPPPGPAARSRTPVIVAAVAAGVVGIAVAAVLYLASPPAPTARPAPPVTATAPAPPVATPPPAPVATAPPAIASVPPPVASVPPPSAGRPEPPPMAPPPTARPPRPTPAPSRPAPPATRPDIVMKPPETATPAPAPAAPRSLRAQVEDRLRSRGLLRGSGADPETGLVVEVSPDNVVTLRGVVRDAAQREEAATLARTAGAADVRLQVNVQSSWN
jgi:serine/threonine-protein kinase